ncbi:diaminopimelate epimerase [Oleiagrimonas sp. C23AA]|uniref:diaminopimelate epimerase n=1 Tax=Oleiagrimonas sp. C23AA TaxID=2719047 RepID=UPI0014223612|nr:diaminopimelate epimerase [Oleiagrimonas sp. C23AA]NII10712.1 diaminopimelate epimerase [Oleiagrimonas sp. C23AA]
MTLPFTKMHGIGNDFVVIDARQTPFPIDTSRLTAMADRHTGVGFDQLLTLEPAQRTDCAYRYGIWNADGSSAGQCGNGARCVAAWLHRAGAIEAGRQVRLESPAGAVGVCVLDDGVVAIDMGEPDFTPASVPFDAPNQAASYALDVAGETLTIGVVSMGNPHALMEVTDLAAPHIDQLGPRVTRHPRFAEQCNVGFAQVIDASHVKLRVHERGAGWTRACGTGACAAAAVLRLRDRVDERVHVQLPGGELIIAWPGPGHRLWMTGPASFVFEGQWLDD